MVESTCILHTSSHPDKYNNSANRIISKEEEREDPKRDTSIFFEYSAFYKNYSVSTRNPATPSLHKLILDTELILLQEISKKYYNYKAHLMQINTRHLPATVPCLQAFYMAETGSQLPYNIPGPHGKGRLPVNSTQQKQHSKQQPASTQPLQQFPGLVLQGILPGEIGFISKGSSIVYLYNTKVSVFQVTYQNNSTRILILSRVLVILCEDTVHYLQSKLS